MLDKDVNRIYVISVQLTLYTDYSLRVLVYLGMRPTQLVTITEMADAYGISRNHLVKVVHHLGQTGYVQTLRGKSGGMRLGKPAQQIVIGEVVRKTEPHMNLLECFEEQTNTCPITNVCALKGALYKARKAFVDTLDRYTLADVLGNSSQLEDILVTRSRSAG
jgi:Rrf2 family transcriptional regulator, nitric oxide-sensitive transcriptional repressor